MVLETQSDFCEEFFREELIERRIFVREAIGIDKEKLNCKRVRDSRMFNIENMVVCRVYVRLVPFLLFDHHKNLQKPI